MPGGALPLACRDPDISSMIANNSMANRKSKPRALARGLAGHKRLKQMFHNMRRDAGAIVFDLQKSALRPVL